ncbi:hypothetical protein ORV05_32675 [Amycolatopsis cynarae]|uniref:Lipoprotein n=1 Tax=Amycolatopsis cynarae TaxID=2995223 RepID=A0ABY7B061_9PSEU|nr:hypothetical protein [Amycolatopsis sp. HUAS 11-8]WAL65586.1 hypothetical protein ORV05_32675 [Amycolatopsis sp. HUAS 11-8]
MGVLALTSLVGWLLLARTLLVGAIGAALLAGCSTTPVLTALEVIPTSGPTTVSAGAVTVSCVAGFARVLRAAVPGRLDAWPLRRSNRGPALPSALTLVEQSKEDCGNEACRQEFTVGGDDGQSTEEIKLQFIRHLTGARGWKLGSDGSGCREEDRLDGPGASEIRMKIQGSAVVVSLDNWRGGSCRRPPTTRSFSNLDGGSRW